jgi:hypothetical protein
VSRERDAGASCACRVPLAEIAEQVGGTVEFVAAQAERLSHVVAPDWASRPALAVADAASLVVWIRAAQGARPQGAP